MRPALYGPLAAASALAAPPAAHATSIHTTMSNPASAMRLAVLGRNKDRGLLAVLMRSCQHMLHHCEHLSLRGVRWVVAECQAEVVWPDEDAGEPLDAEDPIEILDGAPRFEHRVRLDCSIGGAHKVAA